MFDLDGLRQLSDDLVATDVRGLPVDDLMQLSGTLASVLSELTLVQARTLAELQITGLCQARTGDKPAAWLASLAHLPKTAVDSWVRIGVALRRFDQIDLAVADGSLTFNHAQAFVGASNHRVLPGLEAAQEYFVELGAKATFKGWYDELRSFIADIDQDGGHDPDKDLTRNELFLSETLAGLEVRGRLVGAHAQAFRDAMSAETQAQFRQYRADQQLTPDAAMPPAATLRALALVELARRGMAVDKKSSRPPRPEMTLLGNAADPADVTDENGVRIDHESFAAILCDPLYRPLIVDNLGVPLAMGLDRRFATPEQQRALAYRDGGCCWPGCDAPALWTDAHHVIHSEGGTNGRTDLPNLAALCRHHHMVTHRRDWQMHTAPDGWHYWITPSGDRFWQQRRQRLRTDPPPDGPPPQAGSQLSGSPPGDAQAARACAD